MPLIAEMSLLAYLHVFNYGSKFDSNWLYFYTKLYG